MSAKPPTELSNAPSVRRRRRRLRLGGSETSCQPSERPDLAWKGLLVGMKHQQRIGRMPLEAARGIGAREERRGDRDDACAGEVQPGEERPIGIPLHRPGGGKAVNQRPTDQRGRAVAVREQTKAAGVAEEEMLLGWSAETQPARDDVGAGDGLGMDEGGDEILGRLVLPVEEN